MLDTSKKFMYKICNTSLRGVFWLVASHSETLVGMQYINI